MFNLLGYDRITSRILNQPLILNKVYIDKQILFESSCHV